MSPSLLIRHPLRACKFLATPYIALFHARIIKATLMTPLLKVILGFCALLAFAVFAPQLIWVIFVCTFVPAFFFFGYLNHRREMNELHSKALTQFRNASLESPHDQFRFNGSQAAIMDEKVEWARYDVGSTHYVLTVYARNPAGEYFIFRSKLDGPATVKHISPGLAKVILKSKFKP